MTRDPAHGSAKKAEARRNSVPGRRPGRMGKRDQIKGAALVADAKGAADNFIESLERKKLRDRELAYGNNQGGSQEIDFVVHPAGAISNFIGCGNAIAAGGSLTRETTTDCREVNFGADFFFAHPAKLLEPTEECAARGPGERFTEHWLF